MSNAIKFAAVDTLGSTKTYKLIVNGTVLGVVTKTVDHRLTRNEKRVIVATWSFATPFGYCDGYASRTDAANGAIEMLEENCIEEVEVSRAPRTVDVHDFKATTGGFPRGANRWAFSIVGEMGCLIRLASDAMNITAAEKEIVGFVKTNLNALSHDIGAIRSIRLCA